MVIETAIILVQIILYIILVVTFEKTRRHPIWPWVGLVSIAFMIGFIGSSIS